MSVRIAATIAGIILGLVSGTAYGRSSKDRETAVQSALAFMAVTMILFAIWSKP